MLSTTKSAPWVSEFRIMNQPNTPAGDEQHAAATVNPRLPSFSRKPIASRGRPGAALGKSA